MNQPTCDTIEAHPGRCAGACPTRVAKCSLQFMCSMLNPAQVIVQPNVAVTDALARLAGKTKQALYVRLHILDLR